MNDKDKTAQTTPKYLYLTVDLAHGIEGETSRLIGKVQLALKRIGVDQEERNTFVHEAFQDAFDSVVETAGKWVSIKGRK